MCSSDLSSHVAATMVPLNRHPSSVVSTKFKPLITMRVATFGDPLTSPRFRPRGCTWSASATVEPPRALAGASLRCFRASAATNSRSRIATANCDSDEEDAMAKWRRRKQERKSKMMQARQAAYGNILRATHEQLYDPSVADA